MHVDGHRPPMYMCTQSCFLLDGARLRAVSGGSRGASRKPAARPRPLRDSTRLSLVLLMLK
eukprot:11162541-Lingulodinium_polyedra.AAC.1